MPHAYTNGIVSFYEDAGEGPAVVLIHGQSLDLRMWQYQAPALAAAGFRAVRYDVRGHGRSLIPPTGYTWENYAFDLSDLLDRINVERPAAEPLGIAAAHLAGSSMGGAIALQFAIENPQRVLSLALVDSGLPGFGYSEDVTGIVEQLRRTAETKGIDESFYRLWLSHPLFDGVRRFPDRFALVEDIVRGYQAPQYRSVGPEPEGYEPPPIIEALPGIKAPALVVAGEDDLQDYRLIAELLSENIPDARKIMMPGCGHLPPLEAPDAFNSLLIEFLKAHPG